MPLWDHFLEPMGSFLWIHKNDPIGFQKKKKKNGPRGGTLELSLTRLAVELSMLAFEVR